MGLHLSDWTKAYQSKCMRACVIGLPWSKPVQSKKSQRPILTNVCHFWNSCVEFTQRLHIYIYMKSYTYLGCSFRWSLLTIVLLRAACLSPEEGKRKLVHSRFFLPLEPWTNSKTVQCVQYLIFGCTSLAWPSTKHIISFRIATAACFGHYTQLL